MTGEILDTKLNELIGAVYDTVLDPTTWTATLDRIRTHLSFHIAMLGVNALPNGDALVKVSANVPDKYVSQVARYSTEILDIWGGPGRFLRLPLEEPIVQSHVIEPTSYKDNAYFRDWARPQGLIDQMVLVLEHNRTMIASLGFGRHESAPPISEAQVEAMRVLAPHLRRAVTISRLLDTTSGAAASFEATLNASASGIVLVDRQMQVIYANARAEDMLHAGNPITAPNGRLKLSNEVVSGQLDAAVAATASESEMGRRGMGIPARHHDGSALVVHVMPLEKRALRAGAVLRAVAAVFVADAASEPNLPIEALTVLYGLRPAEARVFELIVAGYSSRDIAEALSVAPNTLKTHTQRLFDKLGRHRKADLVQLASELSFPR